MNEIVVTDKEIQRAFDNKEATIVMLNHTERSFLHLGYLLKINRDNKLYKLLDYSTFEEYLGSPEISITRSWAYGLIGIYELYIEKLQREEEELRDAKVAKLLTIKSVVESNPDEWIGKAIALSRSDLKKEVQAAQGKSNGASIPPPRTSENALPGPLALSIYETWIENQVCMICRESPIEKAHFPRTKAAGGTLVVPLCRKCHAEFHTDPKEFVWKYRRHWELYFLKLISLIPSNRLDKKEK